MLGTYGFTVLTPTHNRAHTLKRVYESLKAQTFADFEWVIVDDGSTDGTDALVGTWINEGIISIQYVWQPNQHKKTAFNHGIRLAQGMLTVVLDSDDALLPNSLQAMWDLWNTIPVKKQASYISVTGLCQRPDGQIVGDEYPFDSVDMTALDMYFKYAPKGEKFGALNTEVLRHYPFPETEGFVPESIIWRKIARAGYQTRFVNQVFRVYYENPDSLTANKQMSVVGQSLGLMMLAHDTIENCLPWFIYRPKEFVKSAIRYTRFRLLYQTQHKKLPSYLYLDGFISKLLVYAFYPIGIYFYKRDLKRIGQ